MQYHCIPTRMTKMRKMESTKYWRDVQQLERTVDRNVHESNHFGKLSVSAKAEHLHTLWSNDSILGHIPNNMHMCS